MCLMEINTKFVSSINAEKCEKKCTQSASNGTIYFNQIDIRKKEDEAVFNHRIRVIAPYDDTSPSFIMESKARTSIIDFITYIMGPLGSWIGLSFLVIKSVPFIFKIKDNAVTGSKS